MSGFVPGFENDLFISYAQLDDPAWIQAFELGLGEKLSDLFGVKVSVWQDTKELRAGDNWEAEIESGIKSSAVFIAVISPKYKNSDWCATERKCFQQLFDSPQGFENSRRFFKAVKTPWEDNGHRRFLAMIQHVEFFRPDDALAFRPGTKAFLGAIGVLVKGIAQTLRRLRCERERVYVATPAQDCRDVWKQIREELHEQGYDVQPEGPLDSSYPDDEILRAMEHALLSVHLLGAAHDPFMERQILLAADLEQSLMFWLASRAEESADANQARLIKTLHDGKRPDSPDVALPPGWSMLKDVKPYRLIQAILDFLKPKPAPTVPPPPLNGGAPRVYIVHDSTTKEDARVATELSEEIHQRERMEVFLSRADLPSPTELRQLHRTLLGTCEGVLLYHNAAPQEWLMQVAPEVILAEQLLHRTPVTSKAFLVPDPDTWTKRPGLMVIPYSSQFRPGDLEPFLAPLRTEGSTGHGS